LRTIYFYGFYNINDFYEQIDYKFIPLISDYSGIIESIKKKYNIKVESEKADISIFLILISIGKLFIDKKKYKIHLNEFIEKAEENLEKDIIELKKIEDLIEFGHYKNILKRFGDNKKRVILKDFTASFFQHLVRLLGPKNQLTVELANMWDDRTWNDPYTYFITKFLEENPNIKNKNHITRKNIKKPSMTIPYSIGEKSAWKYFTENIDDLEITNELRKDFKLYFNFVKKLIEGNELFKNKTERMLLYAITNSH
jgi:hypothetical protein